jgi:uncharacterized protein HemY
MKNLFSLVLALLIINKVFGQGDFRPAQLGAPPMKYQALRDTDKDPNAELRENGLKEWKLKKDTVLAKAKKFLEQKDYTAVNQLLYPFDYLEPEEPLFYEYLGKSYYYSGLNQPALDCFQLSYERKKNIDLLFFIGHSLERLGNEREAKKYYKKGAKEGSAACQAKLEE